MILAVAAIALVACSRTFDTHHGTDPAIGFNTWAEHLTKARTQGTSTFASGDDFAVYGYKDMSDDSDPNTVFDDVAVSTTDGTTWTYTTPRFWDSNYDKYIFYAVSPASVGTGGTVDAQTGEITSASITFAGNDNDILVADKKQVDKGSAPYFNNYATVPLVFNHVASLVDFKVKKASSLSAATVTVSAFGLSDIDKTGVLTVDDDYNSDIFGGTAGPVVTWTPSAKGTYGPADGVNSVSIDSPIEIAEDTAFNPESPATPAASTYLINNLVVMPQVFRASDGENPQKLTITYKIAVTGSADIEYTGTLYLADFDFDDDADQLDSKVGRWMPGRHYTFFITLDAHKIDFSASITDWTLVNGYHYLIN